MHTDKHGWEEDKTNSKNLILYFICVHLWLKKIRKKFIPNVYFVQREDVLDQTTAKIP